MAEDTSRFVRSARIEDAEFITRLQIETMSQQLELAMPGAGLPAQLSESDIASAWLKTLQQPPAGDRGVLIAEEDRVPVGFAAYFGAQPLDESVVTVRRDDFDPARELDRGTEIIAFEVAETHRGGGHDSRLLNALADLAGASGIRNLQIWLIAEDQRRIRFFQEAGFAPIGVRRSLAAGDGVLVQHLWYAALPG